MIFVLCEFVYAYSGKQNLKVEQLYDKDKINVVSISLLDMMNMKTIRVIEVISFLNFEYFLKENLEKFKPRTLF